MDFKWPQIVKRESSGTLDEMMTIRAIAGFVEVHFAATDEYGGGEMNLRIPAQAVDGLVRRLEAARDAAALMDANK